MTRHKAIEQILAAVYGVVNGYLRTKKPGKNLDETICSFRCDSANLGFLIKALNERNLWPPKSPDDIRVSIHDFVRCFYRIDKSTYRKPSCSYYDSDSSDDESHTNCYTSLSSVVTSALSSVPTPVSASHTAHMDAAVLEVGCLD